MTRLHTLISAIVIAAMIAVGSVTVRAIVYGFVDTNNTFSNVGRSSSAPHLAASHPTARERSSLRMYFSRQATARSSSSATSPARFHRFRDVRQSGSLRIADQRVDKSDSGRPGRHQSAFQPVAERFRRYRRPPGLCRRHGRRRTGNAAGRRPAGGAVFAERSQECFVHGGRLRGSESDRRRRPAVFHRPQSGAQDVCVRIVRRPQQRISAPLTESSDRERRSLFGDSGETQLLDSTGGPVLVAITITGMRYAEPRTLSIEWRRQQPEHFLPRTSTFRNAVFSLLASDD